MTKKKEGISIPNLVKDGPEDVLDICDWKTVDALLVGHDGKIIFKKLNVEVPEWWGDTQTTIVAEKYLADDETSVKQLFHRVADTITKAGVEQGYFGDEAAKVFNRSLLYLLVTGKFAFNSPVWFNVGRRKKPQCSACFIQSVTDDMASIMDLAKSEVMLFKGGSGTGSNLSSLRSSYESLSKGGHSSGPVSFMEGFDSFAGVTKSGGTTRRAAKMVVLDVDHPDIYEQRNGKPGFITCKSHAEQVAHDLFSTGKYTAEWNVPGNVYDLVGFQNANNSVRVTDEFMSAVEDKRIWQTKARSGSNNEPLPEYRADFLFKEMSKAAWFCGDPGIQFHDIINRWHTCKASGPIRASNPCQPGFATVLTPEGIRTFDDIDVGSVIWTGARWAEVIVKKHTGVKRVLKYGTRAGHFIGTSNHNVISEGGRVHVSDAQYIDVASYEATEDKLTIDPQDVIDGLVVGDGGIKICNNGRNSYTLLYIGTHDQCYFEDTEISPFILSRFDEKAYRVKSTIAEDELPSTYERTVPDRFYFGSRSKVAGFLRGLYSANGSVVGGRVTLKSTSFALIERVQEMLSFLGIRSYYTVNRSRKTTFKNGEYLCRESYDLNITSDKHIFQRLIGFVHPYKNEKLEEAASGPRKKVSYEIISIEDLGEFPVYDLTVNAPEHTYWTGGLLVSNCSEYMFLDDTACNLGSLNLLKFSNGRMDFDYRGFEEAIKVATVAMDIIVDMSSYPTGRIAKNSHEFRTLGLGYTNLGALLASWGVPYDSRKGRDIAAAITAIMTGMAYYTSAALAEELGPFERYEDNKESMLEVIDMHRDEAKRLRRLILKGNEISDYAYNIWTEAKERGQKYGFRNAQVSVLAPTGTISFLMGAETTGIEPMLSCVTYKKLVGGGLLTLPNQTVEMALRGLGYSDKRVASILEHIKETGNIHTAPDFNEERDGKIFAEAIGPNALRPEAHIEMMAAVQPFLSGAISKTVNMPNNSTVEDVEKIFYTAWKLGLKSIAIFRDGCKLSQPISSSKDVKASMSKPLNYGDRKKMPKEREGVTHKFDIGQQEGYIHLGFYDDGSLGEIFVEMSKSGSTLKGLCDWAALATSLALQHGAPFDALYEKFVDMRFEPSGFTSNPDVKFAQSVPDYIFRYIKSLLERRSGDSPKSGPEEGVELVGDPCHRCGNLTKRSGSCFVCTTCGTTSGCS